MINITYIETGSTLSRTKDALLKSDLSVMWDREGSKFTFFTDKPITENCRQSLEKIIMGFAELYGELY